MSITSSTTSSRDYIEIPVFYHEQWSPHYPDFAHFSYDGAMFGPPLQWPVITLDIGIGDKYVVQPWYQFLAKGDFSHEDELSFYYRPHDKIWEIVIRRQKHWGDNDSD
ncbi:hypothetical protein GmHk_20G056960 [Glycine max]|nr:hypothetical protein GmHk_20G056960 [Glycine max]